MKQLELFERVAKDTVSWVLQCDGASRNNPGPAGAGVCVFKNGEPVVAEGFFLGIMTNNEAEYHALLIGLYRLKELVGHNDKITIFSDSELLVRQVLGVYKVKKKELQKLHAQALVFINELKKRAKVEIKHVEREKNKCADLWANKGIDSRIPLPAGIIQ